MATQPPSYSAAPQFSPATYSPAPPINQSSVPQPTPMPNYVQPKTTWQDMATSGKYGGVSTAPMGLKATSPAAKVPPAPTTLPSGMTQPQTLTQGQSFTDPRGNTGTVGFDTATGKPLAAGQTTPSWSPDPTPPPVTGTLPVLASDTAANKDASTANANSATNNTPPPPSDISSSGLLQSLADSTRNNQAITDRSQGILNTLGQNIKQYRANAALTEAQYNGGVIGARGAGLAQQVASYELQQEGAEQENARLALQGENQALAGQSQTQSGLNQAAGYAQPFQVPYSNQLMQRDAQGNVVSVNSGTNGLPPEAQSYIKSLANQVKNGQMTRADAEGRISSYSQPGLQALNGELGSSFNTNASNASAGTTAVGQQIQAAIPPANQALDALQTAFNNLPGIQSTSVPFINQSMQGMAMGTGLGRQQASEFQGALNEARSRIDAAITGVIGIDAARTQAHTLLPDNMVPSEIPQKIAAAKQYLQNQLDSYTNSGKQSSGNTTASQYTKGQTAAGGAIVWNGTQWVPKQN